MPRKNAAPAAPVAAPQADILDREPSWKNIDFATYCTEQSGVEIDPMHVRIMLVLHREWQKSEEHQAKLADRERAATALQAEREQAATQRAAEKAARDAAAAVKAAAKSTAPAAQPVKATRGRKLAAVPEPATPAPAKATRAARKAPAPRATAQPAPNPAEHAF
jgi:hypothetical protein